MANAYESMIKIFREEGKHGNAPPAETGVVLSINPLKIKYKDIILFKENIKINKMIDLQVNDEVFLYPSSDLQTYFLLCVVI